MPTNSEVNILLVDDHPANLLLLEALLADTEARLVRATSGREAVAQAQHMDFAAILLDVHMPEMDGFEAARQIRQLPHAKTTPILFVTATLATDAVIKEAYSLGAVDFLTKPLVAAALKGKVAFFVELFRNKEELRLADAQRDAAERERVKQEQALAATALLRASEARFELLLESSGESIFGMGPGGRCTFVNKAGVAMLGFAADELLGHTLHRLIHHHHADGSLYPEADCRIGLACRQGLPVRVDDEVFWRKDGKPVAVSYSVSPMVHDGQNVGAVITCTDITARKRSEEKLHVLASELAQTDRRKNEFLATLAHELRNPLAPLQNGLQVMRMAPDNIDAVRKAQKMMERQLAHLVHLVNDLLDVARISNGKVELHKARLELKPVIETAIETSLPQIEAGHHELRVSFPPEPLMVEVDPMRLAQVISNLLTNAAKYTPPGGLIELSAGRQGQEVLVSVTDTGVGIPPDQLSAVFEMFTQVHQALDRAQGGLGIGLSLAHRLVTLHGGTLAATSAGQGQGSTFSVRLPLSEAQPARHHASDDRARYVPPVSQHACFKVMVVDDNLDAADSLSVVLEMGGHTSAVAHDGYQALALAPSFLPDVVFLDIGLPGMDGYEVARALREIPALSQVVLIALTGWGTEQDRERTHAAGFDMHLTKPANLDAVEALLSDLAASQAGARQNR